MSVLVIKSWQVGHKVVDASHHFVSISGRTSGLLAWLLSLMGVDLTTTIRVGIDRLEFSTTSLAGTAERLIPLESICSTYYGYHKPWMQAAGIFMLFLWFGSLAGSNGHAIWAGSISLLGVVGAMIYYHLNGTLTLGFVEMSGVVNGIQFKRSLIENIDVDQQAARAATEIVQRLIDSKQRRMRQSVSSSPGPAAR